MMAGGAKATPQTRPQDALALLPRKELVRFRRGRVIYDQTRPSVGIYMIMQGRIKACTTLEDGTQAALGIFGRDDFFGETGLLGLNAHPERATALEDCTLMAWTRAEVEDQIERHPGLGMALMQIAVDRCLHLETRLEALANEKTPPASLGLSPNLRSGWGL